MVKVTCLKSGRLEVSGGEASGAVKWRHFAVQSAVVDCIVAEVLGDFPKEVGMPNEDDWWRSCGEGCHFHWT